jgi:hypothetical protein
VIVEGTGGSSGGPVVKGERTIAATGSDAAPAVAGIVAVALGVILRELGRRSSQRVT